MTAIGRPRWIATPSMKKVKVLPPSPENQKPVCSHRILSQEWVRVHSCALTQLLTPTARLSNIEASFAQRHDIPFSVETSPAASVAMREEGARPDAVLLHARLGDGGMKATKVWAWADEKIGMKPPPSLPLFPVGTEPPPSLPLLSCRLHHVARPAGRACLLRDDGRRQAVTHHRQRRRAHVRVEEWSLHDGRRRGALGGA
eukprot:909711-Prymnesium_polylepis.1